MRVSKDKSSLAYYDSSLWTASRLFERWGLLAPEAEVEMRQWDHGGGFSLNAAVRIKATDRKGLEHTVLCPPDLCERAAALGAAGRTPGTGTGHACRTEDATSNLSAPKAPTGRADGAVSCAATYIGPRANLPGSSGHYGGRTRLGHFAHPRRGTRSPSSSLRKTRALLLPPWPRRRAQGLRLAIAPSDSIAAVPRPPLRPLYVAFMACRDKMISGGACDAMGLRGRPPSAFHPHGPVSP